MAYIPRNFNGNFLPVRDANKLAASLRDVRDEPTRHLIRQQRPQSEKILGRIVAKGPNGEADFTDARYWVQPGNIQGGKVGDPIDFKDNKNFKPSIFPVTNLAEWKSGTHQIAVGEAVSFWLAWDRGSPNRPHWVMSHGGTGSDYREVSISSDGGANSTSTAAATYTYTFTDPFTGDTRTGQGPSWARPLGPLAGPATHGMVKRSGGTTTLLFTDEQAAVGLC